MSDTQKIWTNSLQESQKILNEFVTNQDQINRAEQFTDLIVSTIKAGGNLFACGNGGSHCDAMHFCEEWTGRFRENRDPIGALALGDPSHTTCVANDFGFEHIFERQLRGLGRKGDLLVAISTSGNSPNVLLAVEAARSKGIKTVGLLGKDGGKLKGMVDMSIIIPAKTADRIQEMHIKIIHNVIEAAEILLKKN
jgi:D-sedoheptulose 7-phosphate isomerase